MNSYTIVSNIRMADPLSSQAGPSKPPSNRQNIFLSQKRKAPNEGDSSLLSFKKPKGSQSTTKSKTIKGERMPGGLIINPLPAASGTATKDKGKQREVLPSTQEEVDLEEEVQRMDAERERLHTRELQAQELQSPILPSSTSFQNKAGTSRSIALRHKQIDITQPLPVRDTPLIDRNRAMRGESNDRRTSLTKRGKRASSSFENKGIIPKPHTSLSPSNFHKHIDRDLPEAYRARQLLAWCASRTAAHPPSTASSNDLVPLPPLTAEGMSMLKDVQGEVYKMLEEQRIEISFTRQMDDGNKSKMKPNEQNQKNKQREDDFQRYINRCEREGEVWNSVIQSYNARKSSTLEAVARRRKLSITSDWIPSDSSDPLYERESEGAQLARRCIELATRKKGGTPITLRLAEVENKIDRIHAVVHVADQAANHLSRYLDMRFKVLSAALALRNQPPSQTTDGPTLSQLISNDLVPSTGSSGAHDTVAILRALTRTDMEHPRDEMTDEARKAARDVQRVNTTPGRKNAISGPSGERRLTTIASKAIQGTPRRPGTPRQHSEGPG